MAQTKTETLTVRILPEVKEGLRAMAEQERRSLANMLEVMIRAYCDEKAPSLLKTHVKHGR
ncbi:ribbon-helix-helix protein, CopG family [Thiolapillus sp.]